jgi:enoyl-CoA hydratase
MSVRVEQDGPVTTVTIDRQGDRGGSAPTCSEPMATLAEAFRMFDGDASRSVAVLSGAGGTFCAGADLKAMDNRVAVDGDGPMGPTRLRLSKPVIAAVEGYAVAGGLELALWCDLRVAAEDATFGVFCRRWGVPLVDGGTVRLPRLIGLVNRVVQSGQAVPAAQELARELAAFPQDCLRNDRASLLDQHGLTEQQAMVRELEHGLTSMASGGEGAPGGSPAARDVTEPSDRPCLA